MLRYSSVANVFGLTEFKKIFFEIFSKVLNLPISFTGAAPQGGLGGGLQTPPPTLLLSSDFFSHEFLKHNQKIASVVM